MEDRVPGAGGRGEHGLPLPRRGAARPRSCGGWSPRAATRSGSSRRTAAGTWRACTTRTRTTPAPATPARADSCTTPTGFDAEFFGISPREALAMDPQQRLLLEVVLGGARARRHRPRLAARAAATGVFAGRRPPGLRPALHGSTGGAEGYLLTGNATSVVSGRVAYTLRARRARGDGGHGVFVVAGGHAPGLPGAAAGRVRPGPGRRRDGDGDPGRVRRVLPAARAGPRRPVQGVRRGRRRHRLRRGRRAGAAGAAVGRPPPRPPGAGGDPRLGRQPGRRLATA